MKQEIKLSGGLSITLDDEQKQELLEKLTDNKDVKELIKQEILEMLKKYKSNVGFLTSCGKTYKYPTSRFEIFNNYGVWLFDIDYNSENKHFWYSYHRIYKVFSIKYSINYDDLQEVMKDILEEHLDLKGVTPQHTWYNHIKKLEEYLN